jgi:hypothetical protein
MDLVERENRELGEKMPHSEGGLEWGEGDPTGGRSNHKPIYVLSVTFKIQYIDVINTRANYAPNRRYQCKNSQTANFKR